MNSKKAIFRVDVKVYQNSFMKTLIWLCRWSLDLLHEAETGEAACLQQVQRY